MGHTIRNLASRSLDDKSIFSNRFCVELAEQFHVHYRNLRLILSVADFKEISKGFVQALQRWEQRGRPEPTEGQHIELCRKNISGSHNAGIQINLNKNLYNLNKDKIYADGADFIDENYVHVKIRDKRIECSLEEFRLIASAFREAEENLDGLDK